VSERIISYTPQEGDVPPVASSITNGVLTVRHVDADPAGAKVVKNLIVSHHYSRKTTPNRFASFAVSKHGETEILGALQLGYGIRPHMKHTVSSLITKENYCEFDRMWLDDALPKNSESQVISLLLAFVKVRWPQIRFVITYADGSVGNVGTIYKATNAIPIGKSPVDFYILPPTEAYPNGERVHPVTMWHRHRTRNRQFLEQTYPGYKHIKGGETGWQYKFLYILHHGTRKAYEREQVERTKIAEPGLTTKVEPSEN
jgi:hypothetical protein